MTRTSRPRAPKKPPVPGDAARRPERPPTHPGAVLRDEVLPALGVGVSQAARDLGVSRQVLHGILGERVAVSPEMALKLGRFCGSGPAPWATLQMRYDLWRARQRLGKALEAVPKRKAVVSQEDLCGSRRLRGA